MKTSKNQPFVIDSSSYGMSYVNSFFTYFPEMISEFRSINAQLRVIDPKQGSAPPTIKSVILNCHQALVEAEQAAEQHPGVTLFLIATHGSNLRPIGAAPKAILPLLSAPHEGFIGCIMTGEGGASFIDTNGKRHGHSQWYTARELVLKALATAKVTGPKERLPPDLVLENLLDELAVLRSQPQPGGSPYQPAPLAKTKPWWKFWG